MQSYKPDQTPFAREFRRDPYGRLRSFQFWIVLLSTVAAAGLGVPAEVRSDDVYLLPSVSATTAYDDNVRLDPDDPDSQTSLKVLAEAELGIKNPIRDIILKAASRSARYSDEELDTDDWFLDLELKRRTRRDEFDLLTSYRRESTITTEFDDSGNVRNNRRRETWAVSPTWRRTLSQRTDGIALYQFADVSYEDGAEVGLFDYQTHRIETSLIHRLTATTTVDGRLDALRFESEAGNDSDNVGLLAGLTRVFSPTFTAGLALGVRYTDTEFLLIDGSRENATSTGPLYEAIVIWTQEKGELNIIGSRNVEPSGRGELSDVDSLRVTWKYPLSRAWEFSLAGGAARRELANPGTQIPENRKYYDAQSQITWRGRPRWEIGLAYKYRRQDFDSGSSEREATTDVADSPQDSADSNAVWLTISYTWAQIDLAR